MFIRRCCSVSAEVASRMAVYKPNEEDMEDLEKEEQELEKEEDESESDEPGKYAALSVAAKKSSPKARKTGRKPKAKR